MRQRHRWMVRIGLCIVAFLVAAFAVLLISNPDATLISMAVLLSTLFATNRPPAIADGIITADDWMHWDAAGRKLTNVLEEKFPPGTPEAALRSALLKQGFKPPKAAANCVFPWRPVDLVPRCLPVLQYDWRNGVCRHTITVNWTADHSGEISGRVAGVSGGYGGSCL